MTKTDSRSGSTLGSLTAVIVSSPSSGIVVAGVPLLLRAVLSAQRAGIGRVLVQGDGVPEDARGILARDARARDVEIVASDQLSLSSSVIVIEGDRLMTPRIVEAIAEAASVIPDSPFCHPREGGDPSVERTSLIRMDSRLRGNDGMRGAVHVRSAADVPRAEAALIAELRSTTLDTDGPIARIDRALSLRLSRVLVRTSLRPNHITMIGTCIGLLAAWALAQGSYGYGLLGSLLFWVAVIVDGCDGEVARLKFLETRFGQLFDVVTDNIVHVAIFAGMALGAYQDGRIERVLLFGTILIAGFLCASAATYFCLLGDGPVKHLAATSARGRMRQRFLQFFEALMNRDFAYLLAVLALADRLHWFLWGTVFGTYAYAIGLVCVYRFGDGAARPRRSNQRLADSSLR